MPFTDRPVSTCFRIEASHRQGYYDSKNWSMDAGLAPDQPVDYTREAKDLFSAIQVHLTSFFHFYKSVSVYKCDKKCHKFCIIFDSCQHRLNASSCMKVLFTSNFSLSTFVFIPSFYYTLIIYLLFRYLIFYLFMF